MGGLLLIRTVIAPAVLYHVFMAGLYLMPREYPGGTAAFGPFCVEDGGVRFEYSSVSVWLGCGITQDRVEGNALYVYPVVTPLHASGHSEATDVSEGGQIDVIYAANTPGPEECIWERE